MIFKPCIQLLAICLGLFPALSGCTLGPDYQRPAIVVPPVYREAAPWKEATPGDTLDKGAWWQLFADPVLDDLQERARAAN